ncbi:MAG: hypothetical protein AAF934_00060 [Bacteroidota bacterium]
MNYNIEIIDTQDNGLTTQLEIAQNHSIVLQWHGGDEKTPAVVGSSLLFTMQAPAGSEGHFLDLFTGDENRYRVTLTIDDTGETVWQGHLLPDSYSEPYARSAFFVSFEATCGLGRLKGKYLPDTYYDQEKTVVDIISRLLSLTGLELELYFSPAIENYTQKDYTTIYIDTATFKDKDTKKDAYAILAQLVVNDMCCVVFQADNRWHVEGINKRHLRTYTAQRYAPTGAFIEALDPIRNLKHITALATPSVTMVPPLSRITISHKREAPAFADTITKEANKGWAVVTGVNGELYPIHWNGNGGFYPKARYPDYGVRLYNSNIAGGDPTRYIDLREKIYLQAGEKYSLNIAFKIVFSGAQTNELIDTIVSGGHWDNPIHYTISLNSSVLFSNHTDGITQEEHLNFNAQKTASITFEFITEVSGLLDVRLYEPFGLISDNHIEAIALTDMTLQAIGFKDQYLTEDEINGEYTVAAEVELHYADDASGFSKGFRLAQLKQVDMVYNTITVPILYGFEQDGINYAVVPLDGAKLINDNISTVYYNAGLLTDLEVTYNYQGGEQMVVNTGVEVIGSGSFQVRVYLIEDYTQSRVDWLKWGDAIYSIEQLRYGQAVRNIYRRMFNQAHQKIDLTANHAVKFNDILSFSFVGFHDYFVTSCAWNITAGTTELTMIRGWYGSSGANIPPIVDAGGTVEIADMDTATQLTATAEDPDGFIVSVQWTLLSGDPGVVIQTPNDLTTTLTNLSGDVYSFQVEVTDNNGATASDTVDVIRIIDYTVALVLVDQTIASTPDQIETMRREWQFQITPALAVGHTLQLVGNWELEVDKVSGLLTSIAEAQIIKNTVELEYSTIEGNATQTQNFLINYINGDDIRLVGYVEVTNDDPDNAPPPQTANAETDFNVTAILFASGTGNIVTVLPINVDTNVSLS